MAQILRHGIVGCGVIGPFHARCIARMQDDELVALCDLEKEKAQKMADEYGGKVYTSYSAMLKREDIDVIHVCTPSGLHAKMGIQAALAGKHVIVEKPIDIKLAAADKLIETCKQQGVKLTCISQNRFRDGVQKLKKTIEEGKLGRLYRGYSSTKWYRTQQYYDSGGWRGTWKLDGGGAIMNQSVHYVDLLLWMMGEPAEIYAYAETLAHKIEVEDIAVAVIKFKNGAVGVLEGSTDLYPGFAEQLEVHGENGTVMLEGGNVKAWHFKDEEQKKQEEAGGSSGAGDAAAIGVEGHQTQLEDFSRAIRENREPYIKPEEGRRAIEVILALYKSAKTGRVIKFK